MRIIGITGGSGAGKSTVLKALIKIGAKPLDCDEVYHDLLINNVEMTAEIEAHFKGVSDNGKIDRKKLGEIVWRDPASLHKLNDITHKHINHEIDRQINEFRKQGEHTIAIDAIALIESGQSKRCDEVIGVIAPMEKRISRIMERDGLTKNRAEMRINAQKPDSFFRLNCSHILENDFDTLEEFENKCDEYFSIYKGD